LLSIAILAAFPACAGHDLSSAPADELGEPIGTSMDSCPSLAGDVTLTTAAGDIVITAVCMRDELGRYYDSELSDTPLPSPGVPIVPAGHRYSVVYRFAPAYASGMTHIASSSTAYVAADSVLPEEDAENLVATTSTLDGDLLVQSLADPLAAGEHVDSNLDIDALFSGALPCAEGGICGAAFDVRFYVGASAR
jgi:hypothetical protein